MGGVTEERAHPGHVWGHLSKAPVAGDDMRDCVGSRVPVCPENPLCPPKPGPLVTLVQSMTRGVRKTCADWILSKPGPLDGLS